MDHKEGEFKGLNGINIYHQAWKVDEAKAAVIIVHGFGEHSGRYMNVVNQLNPIGVSVYALDHQGQGKSAGKANHVNRFTDYFEDLETFQELVLNEIGDLPLFMIGHSMGSIIANNFMARNSKQSRYSGLVLSGTGSDVGPGINAITKFLAKILSSIAPKLSLASNLDPNFISHDQEVVNAYINDPLVRYKKITTRLGAEMMKYTISMKNAAMNISLPALVLVGEEDETFSGKQELIDAFPNENKELKIYEGYRHEVFNEIGKELVLEDLTLWMNELF